MAKWTLRRKAKAGQMTYTDGVWVVTKYNDPGPIIHLTFSRVDRTADHDWRELQRIKNEILGPEYEAVELYPAESRLVDSANQFHLWALKDCHTFPFGFKDGRCVSDIDALGAKQRPGSGATNEDEARLAANMTRDNIRSAFKQLE